MSDYVSEGDLISRSEMQAFVKVRSRLGANLPTIREELKSACKASRGIPAIGQFQAPVPNDQTLKAWIRNASIQSVNISDTLPIFPGRDRRVSQQLSATVIRINDNRQGIEDFDLALKNVLKKWQRITRSQQSIKLQFRDEEFQASGSSILFNTRNVDYLLETRHVNLQFHVDNVKWFRPYQLELKDWSSNTEQYWQSLQAVADDWRVYSPATTPHDINQGALGNCWFITAMSLIVLHRLPLQQIVLTPDFQRSGCYALRLCIEGRWQAVLVDDKFPFYNNSLLFSKAANRQLWVSLIEKAMAKSFGCYEALVGGSVCEGLSTLTGEPVESIAISKSDTFEIDEIWAKLRRFSSFKYLIGAATIDDGNDDMLRNVGLVANHCYAILEVQQIDSPERIRLMRLRNPWGNSTWQGDWSDSSSKWEKYRSLASYLEHTSQNEGSFWMTFEDFAKYFSLVDVCKLRPNWQEARYTAPFYRQPERSCLVTLVTVCKRTPVEVILHQMGLRKVPRSQRLHLDMTIFICSVHSETDRETDVEPIEIVGTSQESSVHGLVQAGEFILPVGQYAVVALSFRAACSQRNWQYAISIHSKLPLPAATVTIPSPFIGQVLLQYAVSHGKQTNLEEGLSIYKTSDGIAAFIIVAENKKATKWHYLKIDCSLSKNVEAKFRGSLVTSDIIPAGMRQVVQVLNFKEDASNSVLQMKFSHRTAAEREVTPDYPKFSPPVEDASRAFMARIPID